MAGFATLLAATDLSDPALSALREASELADRLGSRLVVTHVVEDRLPPVVAAHTSDPEALLKRHREHAEKAVAEHLAQHLPGKRIEIVVRQGIVHQQIVQLAAERKADLIVMGMHGHGSLRHALAGSTAERVLHHAPCSVLVVPHDS